MKCSCCGKDRQEVVYRKDYVKPKYAIDLGLDDRKEIIVAYRDKLESAISIGKRYKVNRHCILGILKRSGIDISKKSKKIEIKCSCCDKNICRRKARVEASKHLFCDMVCYKAWLEVGNGKGKYKASRWGTGVARIKVSKLFDLKEGYIIHHEDRDCLNNEVNNLKVFACQGDHVRHHRGFDVTPLWEG